MGDIIRRLLWFFVVSCAVAYVIFLAAGSAINAQAVDRSRVVTIRDVLKPGVHHLSGMVMVPSSCAQLSVRAEMLSTTTYLLRFKTWEEPYVECTREDTPRAFNSIVFAPAAGVDFLATLDDEPLAIVVIPVLQRK